MRGQYQDQAAVAADAYLAWWRLAGVECAVAEAPVDWLRPVSAPQVASGRAPDRIHEPAPHISEKPGTLELFQHWIASDSGQPERRWPGPVLLPTGPADAPLMIITDMPDAADMAAGTLMGDAAGRLLDAMLRAIGLKRDDVHVGSLFFSRPPGGMVEASDLITIAERVRLHVSLARPRRLLLLGDRTKRALIAANDGMDAKGLRDFNHQGGIVPAVATFHPRLLLTQPMAKAECWQDLQSLIEDRHS
jgi:uracil-DNA glycosylase family 4